MAERHPRVYTIAPDAAFVDTLARGLFAMADHDPTRLARMQVLLPNRRSVRAMTDALVRQSGARATLMPRLIAIGDVDEDEALGSFLDGLDADDALPPAIGPVERLLELARLTRAWAAARGRAGAPAAEAHRLAVALAHTLDQLIIERVPPAALREATPEVHAEHWRQTLDFLAIVLDAWPRHLAERGLIDAAERRNRLLDRLARRWRDAPPATPIIAAGSTGSIPATAELLKVVARLPEGCVVLPGLDADLDDDAWAAIDPRHPQHGLKLLLDTLDVGRHEVLPWPADEPATGRTGGGPRDALIRLAMLPPSQTARWQRATVAPAALDDLAVLEAANPAEEALAIALALRQALDDPEATAALVTPDRTLARRVAGHLKRFGLAIDDSAGMPLANTPPAAFMRLLAQAVIEDLAPVALLALLKHPLMAAGDGRAAHLAATRRLDARALRGARAAPGIAGIGAAIRQHAPELADWWQPLADALAPLLALVAADTADGAALLATHIAAAETLAGADALWAGEAGRALSARLAELVRLGALIGPLTPADYPALFHAWLDDVVVRQSAGSHPRLAVWGTIEARLQRADLMILGGLNEGTWPATPAPDPWLAPAIRRQLGLPTPERRIGQSAHDFAQALGARRVLLTRARKDGTAPTVPSRLLLRLETASGGALPPASDLLAVARALDAPAVIRAAEPPAPAPDPALRPRQLSVTEVEKLLTDPYAFYARRMLGLRRLDPLATDPDPSAFGTLVHDGLDQWWKGGDHSVEALRTHLLGQLEAHIRQPLPLLLQRPRILLIADWVVGRIAERAPDWAVADTEVSGAIMLGDITLTGRADRIDRGTDGRLAIVDYKTGAPPSHTQRQAGYAPQLPLLAAIAERGGFKGFKAAPVGELRYWKLSGGKQPGEDKDALLYKNKPWTTVDAWIARTLAELDARVITRLLLGRAPFRSKAHPAYAKGADYDRLARVAEWFGRADNRGDGTGHD
ncbi:double-strand break repair protein AddB [Parapedomonas caeni]